MDIFEGTPRDKFFDIIFNANRNLVEDSLENLVMKFIALNKICEKNSIDIYTLDKYLNENLDDIKEASDDFFIEFTSDILSNNE